MGRSDGFYQLPYRLNARLEADIPELIQPLTYLPFIQTLNLPPFAGSDQSQEKPLVSATY